MNPVILALLGPMTDLTTELKRWRARAHRAETELVGESDRTRAAVAEALAPVLALHVEDEDVKAVSRCAECIKFYPCPTARALGVEE